MSDQIITRPSISYHSSTFHLSFQSHSIMLTLSSSFLVTSSLILFLNSTFQVWIYCYFSFTSCISFTARGMYFCRGGMLRISGLFLSSCILATYLLISTLYFYFKSLSSSIPSSIGLQSLAFDSSIYLLHVSIDTPTLCSLTTRHLCKLTTSFFRWITCWSLFMHISLLFFKESRWTRK